MHGHANGIKTAVLIATMSGLILLAGLWIGRASCRERVLLGV